MLAYQQGNRPISDDISTADSAIAASHQRRFRRCRGPPNPPNPPVRSHCATAQSAISEPSTQTILALLRNPGPLTTLRTHHGCHEERLDIVGFANTSPPRHANKPGRR